MNLFNHVKSRLFRVSPPFRRPPSLRRGFDILRSVVQVTLTLLAAVLIVHYWHYVASESHPPEPLFVINSSVNRARAMQTSALGNASAFAAESVGYFNESSSHNATSNATATEISPRSNEMVLCPLVPPNLREFYDFPNAGPNRDARKGLATRQTATTAQGKRQETFK